MNKLLVKNITLFVGGITVFATGLLYVLLTDVLMSNTATWLFIGIILALGSSVLFFLGESFKEKINIFLIFKVASVVLAIGFVAFLFVFKAKASVYTDIVLPEKIAQANATIIICVIFGILGTLVEAANGVLGYLTRNDE